jgi:hypothetical protein
LSSSNSLTSSGTLLLSRFTTSFSATQTPYIPPGYYGAPPVTTQGLPTPGYYVPASVTTRTIQTAPGYGVSPSISTIVAPGYGQVGHLSHDHVKPDLSHHKGGLRGWRAFW